MDLRRILIVTVNKIETRFTLEVFSKAIGTPWGRKVFNGKTYIYIGQISNFEIYLIRSEMGNSGPSSSQSTINRAIDDLAPEAIIMLGVAFGIDPQNQKIGDVLVSKQIMGYEAAKIKEMQIQRGDKPSSSPDLLAMFRNGEIDWDGSELNFGLVLSGEKLVANQEFRDWLISIEPEAIGGEMEGVGLYAAAHGKKVDWILVKGICDWGDENKNDEDQILAAQNAAKFTLHVLQSNGLENNDKETLSRQDLPSNRSALYLYQKELLYQIKNPFIYQLQKELIEHMDKYFPSPESDIQKSENYLAILYFSREKEEIGRVIKTLQDLYLQKPEHLSDEMAQRVNDQLNEVEKCTTLTLELVQAAFDLTYDPLGESIINTSKKVIEYIENASAAIVYDEINQIWSSLMSLKIELEIYNDCLDEINEHFQGILKK